MENADELHSNSEQIRQVLQRQRNSPQEITRAAIADDQIESLMAIAPNGPQGEVDFLRAQEVRERLLLATAALMQQVGYVQLRIKDVAAAVNVPPSSFYTYFANKEQLAMEIVQRQFTVLFESLQLPGEAPALERLRLHFEFAALPSASIDASPIQLIGALQAEASSLPSTLHLQVDEGVELWILRLTKLLALAQEQGDLAATDDPRQLAIFLVNCWQGAMLRRKCNPSKDSFERFARFALDRLLPLDYRAELDMKDLGATTGK